MTKTILQIPTGYTISEKKQTLNIAKAKALLLSGKQTEYSSATNNLNNTATLIHNSIRCPFCDCQVPLKSSSGKWLSNDTIAKWAAEQLSVFDKNFEHLKINDPTGYNKQFLCPNCKKTSKKADFYYNITIEKDRHKITISHNILNISDLLCLPNLKNINITNPFDYKKTIVFNLGNGHTYLQVEGNKKDVVYVRDFTEAPSELSNEVIHKLILTSQTLRRHIKNAFKNIVRFTFPSQMLTLEKLILATRFVGYNQNFYYGIPFLSKEYKLFYGFKGIAKKMHKADNIPTLYKRVGLPSNKVTKRLILSNPSLMFYYREILSLCSMVNNYDYIRRILSMPNIYNILAELNCMPVVKNFLQEAFKYESQSVVIDLIEKNFYPLIFYGMEYMCSNESIKKAERNQAKWLRSRTDGNTKEYLANPSVIRSVPSSEITDCRIDSFCFEWLVHSNAYKKAADKLHNCLDTIYAPVIAIKSDYGYIAAISLDSSYKQITQAKMAHNKPVSDSLPLYKAIEKWCKRYSIIWTVDR